MSKANVEVVRGIFEAFLRGDEHTALDAFDPNVEYDARTRPDGRVFHGREGVREAVRVWVGTWEDYQVEIQEYIDAGDDVILVMHESGRGKGSGLEIDQLFRSAWTVRDGKVVRVREHPHAEGR